MQNAASNSPAFILIRPQMGENIGASARAMWNFGLARMRVVAPRDGWPNERAVALASGAGRVLDAALHYDSTAAAIEDCAYVYATTSRARDLTKPVLSPDQAMADAARRMAAGQGCAVLFGPERTGLENEDVARANALISVPVNPDFPSINLAQCVLLTAYEWRRAAGGGVQTAQPMHQGEMASHAEIDALAAHYEARLEEAGFFYPPPKAPGMKLNLRNMWARLDLTRADAQMLHGALRQLLRSRDAG